MNKILENINDLAGRMSAIDRYSQTRLANPESVLEHTGWVCFCSLMIADELIANGERIDLGKLLASATIHDVEEIIVGDIPSPTKYSSNYVTKGLKDFEDQSAKKLLSDRMYKIWKNSKSGKEGFIVELADKLAVVYKIQQETMDFGNNTIRGHADNMIPVLTYLYECQISDKIMDNQKIIVDIINEAIKICQIIKA